MTTLARARRRSASRAPWVALGAAAVLALPTAPPALAVPGPATPASPEAAELDGRIAAAESRIAAADRAASEAVEDLNAAREAARQARSAARRAEQAATRAEDDLAGARRVLGSLASRAYRQGPDLVAADLLRSRGEPEDLLDRMTVLRHVADEQDARVQRLAAAAVVADVLRAEATGAAERAAAAEAAVAGHRVETAARLAAAEAEVDG
ncbi:MAG: hypothetical protein ACFCVG_18980, partial [Kineosporiaceae bacterium]